MPARTKPSSKHTKHAAKRHAQNTYKASSTSRKQAHTTQSIRNATHPTFRIIAGLWRGKKLFLPSHNTSAQSSLHPHSSTSTITTHSATPTTSSITPTIITRPTKAIVRESCFHTIARDVKGACFIEGFAGSGSMGIEALSQGADMAIFCEQDEYALQTIARNLSMLPINIATSIKSITPYTQATLIKGDSFHTLPTLFSLLSCPPFTMPIILYLDPPFAIRKDYGDIYKSCANLISSLSGIAIRKIAHSKNRIPPPSHTSHHMLDATHAIKHIIIEHSSAYAFPTSIGAFHQYKCKKFGNSTLTYFTQGV